MNLGMLRKFMAVMPPDAPDDTVVLTSANHEFVDVESLHLHYYGDREYMVEVCYDCNTPDCEYCAMPVAGGPKFKRVAIARERAEGGFSVDAGGLHVWERDE
jgi:hypothetical protein